VRRPVNGAALGETSVTASAGHTLISPETLAKDLGGWTTDELLAEVLERSAGDRPAFQLLQATIIRALLTDSDRKFVAGSD
jgi:hypothetical protein